MTAAAKLKKIEDKELEIVKAAIEDIEQRKGHKLVQAPEVQAIINTVEKFIISKKLVCYGGTAINNIMPEQYRFYNTDIELPDYDFYSPTAIDDARELADIFFKMGYNEVEAKAGAHPGTFKVFVNFMAIADITNMERTLFKTLQSRSFIKGGIHYAPTDFLRMAMYLELSRPEGDVSRWEKVLKRLTLLNKAYPLKLRKCNNIELQRPFGLAGDSSSKNSKNSKTKAGKKAARDSRTVQNNVYDITQRVLLNSDVVFIGGFADILYTKYLPKKDQHKLARNPEFDVLSNSPKDLADLIKMTLSTNGIEGVHVEKMPGIGEIVSDHYKVSVGDNIIVLVYKPTACHSYNTVKLNGQPIKVASVDTMLMLYLAFSYADRDYYNRDRIMCLASLLFYIQNENRTVQTGLLKRFGRSCFGTQETLESLRKEKAVKFDELKDDKKSDEYQKLFLRYIPLMLRSSKTRAVRKYKKSNRHSTHKKRSRSSSSRSSSRSRKSGINNRSRKSRSELAESVHT